MYLSLNQISLSTLRLQSLHAFFGFAFLAVKKFGLPVGRTTKFTSKFVTSHILDKYYRLLNDVPNYFSPFATSDPSNRWISPRYASTSLQRIMADTFGSAFLHEKGSSQWGWVQTYVEVLENIRMDTHSSKIPLLDLCVWLNRGRAFDSGVDVAGIIRSEFLSEFGITANELRVLFEDEPERGVELEQEKFDLAKLLNIVGWPEDGVATTGSKLTQLGLRNVGPATNLSYSPSSRLNVVVGDNSVGKTFLLDTAWWSLTGAWSAYPAEPKDRNSKRSSEISATLSDSYGRQERSLALFDSVDQGWQRKSTKSEGFGIYARHDGSFAVWDTLRPSSPRWRSLPNTLVFDRRDTWEGLTITDASNRRRHVSKGLIDDVVAWRADADRRRYRLFTDALKTIADGTEILGLGPHINMPDWAGPVPTIRMPYGNVPIVYASAGAQRALSISYLLVLSWTEHESAAKSLNRNPYSSIVVMLDEMEAHLHPKWQRRVLPAIRQLLTNLSRGADAQFHIATHSPIILASVEPDLDRDRDTVHILELNENSIVIDQKPLVRHGTVDSWLMSELFDLKSARSLPAERAIEAAKLLQASAETAEAGDVEVAHQALLLTLPDDDTFWIRWNYFRERVLASHRKSS